MTGQRTLKQRVRTARGRSHASQLWLARQLNDPFVHQARHEGYRARSVYKLKELDERFKLIRRGHKVVDLGAAPGSWSQYAARMEALVVAIDLLPLSPIAGVELLEGDFMAPATQDALATRLEGGVDLVLSDMAANATGQRLIDRLKAEGLAEAVLDFAVRTLRPHGHCLVKLVKGGEAALLPRVRAAFKSAHTLRPKATRPDSSETYLLARDFQGAARPAAADEGEPAAVGGAARGER